MKSENFTKDPKEILQETGREKLINRREALNKAGVYALSAATMMILMKSQAKAQTSMNMPVVNMKPISSGQEWKRTNRP